jgi:hypothetical protein
MVPRRHSLKNFDSAFNVLVVIRFLLGDGLIQKFGGGMNFTKGVIKNEPSDKVIFSCRLRFAADARAGRFRRFG